ncbi:interleukin-1 receptor type 2-like [Aulostomus maculatus]
MVYLVLVAAAAILQHVHGRPPPLPPLPMKDGCYWVSQEVELFRMEGEAIVVSFPIFQSVLKKRSIASASAKYIITRGNNTTAHEDEGHVQRQDRALWLLPGHTSDSGQYTCTYRNETYCITGRIRLYVYNSTSVDMKNLLSEVNATVGENVPLMCPPSDFSHVQTRIKWNPEPRLAALQLGALGSSQLLIPAVKLSDAGFYSCQLRVLINNQEYNITRVYRLIVRDPESHPDQTTATTVPDSAATSDPGSSTSTVDTPALQPPLIISPLNGTVFESSHGSGLELFCQVLTGCDVADSTGVSWLVGSQPVESSYLGGRALQGGRRVTRMPDGCQIELRLIVASLTEEDTKTVLKCVTENRGGRQEVVLQLQLEDSTFTWLAVAAVGVSCFLTVALVFLYVLFKPKKKRNMDYVLARQNSTF